MLAAGFLQVLRVIVVLAAVLCAQTALAAPKQPEPTDALLGKGAQVPVIEIKAGHSKLFNLPRHVKRASVAKVEIADLSPITDRQIYVKGVTPGTTNLTLWDDKDVVIGVYELVVQRDLSRIKERIAKILPNEAINIAEENGMVVLWGYVSSFEAKHDAEALVMALLNVAPVKADEVKKDTKEQGAQVPQASKGFVSLLKVGGSQQIHLKVRFGEVNKKITDRLNVNFGAMNLLTGDYLFSMINSLISLDETTWTSGKTPDGTTSHPFSTKLKIASNTNMAFGFKLGDTRILGFLDVLKQNGFAKILAEPTLVTTSGKKAEFLAGGEFPIPVPSRDYVTIEYKKFGVELNFTPEITQEGRIKINVKPQVSEIDYANAVVMSNYLVPGLTKRMAHGELDLADGESFVLAGLFRDDITHTVSKLPLLGDLPILGALFRSTEFKQNQTELLIEVTPTIVRTSSARPAALPTDSVVAPNEGDMMLMGVMTDNMGQPSQDLHFRKSGARPMPTPNSLRSIEGGFGHDYGN